ncbi:MAG: hypothetical protein ABIF77_09845, partial [bacterium]
MQPTFISKFMNLILAANSGRASSWRAGFVGVRPRLAFLAVAVLSLFGTGSTFAQCIDYGDYVHWVGGVDTPGDAYGVAVQGDFAYVGDEESGLQVIDISTPESPLIVGSVDTPGSAYCVTVQG